VVTFNPAGVEPADLSPNVVVAIGTFHDCCELLSATAFRVAKESMTTRLPQAFGGSDRD
jgi:hypothetical protein